jgi:hypothetical protein
MMAVEISPGNEFQASSPKPLFEARLATFNVTYSVSKDGRFLLPVLADGDNSAPLTVIQNWTGLLK